MSGGSIDRKLRLPIPFLLCDVLPFSGLRTCDDSVVSTSHVGGQICLRPTVSVHSFHVFCGVLSCSADIVAGRHEVFATSEDWSVMYSP